jgi:hypothetical protein
MNGLLVALLSNICLYFFIPFFRTRQKLKDNLYKTMQEEEVQLKLLKEWEEMNQENIRKTVIGVVINLIFSFFAFYFTFSFCAVYTPWQKVLMFGWIASVMLDALMYECGIELIVFLFYWCRGCSSAQ